MHRKHCLHSLAAFIVIALAAQDAQATFHRMQIEQVVGGVCGDTTSQAVQLRMKVAGQNQVGTNSARLIARDASGANPVTLIVFPSNVVNSSGGSRILVTSTQFASDNPTPSSDFTMTNLIPASYLAAGRLTFEDSFGTIYWSLSWGGASYTGSTTGNTINDADGDFGPPFDGPLPTSNRGLLFQGSFSSPSTNNAADYAVTSGEAVVTNNSGGTGPVSDCSIFIDGFESGDTTFWSPVVP